MTRYLPSKRSSRNMMVAVVLGTALAASPSKASASAAAATEPVAKAAAEALSPRQRRILELTADGWPVPEIASELKTTVERVSDEKYKAIKKLQHAFGVA